MTDTTTLEGVYRKLASQDKPIIRVGNDEMLLLLDEINRLRALVNGDHPDQCKCHYQMEDETVCCIRDANHKGACHFNFEDRP